MNRLLFLFLCLASLVAEGQSNYTQAINQGDSAREIKQFDLAINKYFAAEAFDPTQKKSVKLKVDTVFFLINKLKIKAESDKYRAVKAEKLATLSMKDAENAKNNALKSDSGTKVAFAQSKKLVSAFYFYADRFALAFKDDKFYFIDINGDKVDKLEDWDKAEQFGILGLSKVTGNTVEYLLDTSGNKYQLVYKTEDIDNSTRAVNISDRSFSGFPAGLF
jgi:hypothetical protein